MRGAPRTLVYEVMVAGLAKHHVEVEEDGDRYTTCAPGFTCRAYAPREAVRALARWHRWDVINVFDAKGAVQ